MIFLSKALRSACQLMAVRAERFSDLYFVLTADKLPRLANSNFGV